MEDGGIGGSLSLPPFSYCAARARMLLAVRRRRSGEERRPRPGRLRLGVEVEGGMADDDDPGEGWLL